MMTQKIDTGLACLVTVAKMMGLPVDPEQMRRAYVVEESGIDMLALVRAARELGLKASIMEISPTKIAKIPLPAIAIMKDGTYVVLARVEKDSLVVLDPEYDKPVLVSNETFIGHWAGAMILVARRFDLKAALRKFGLSWFIPVILGYKKALAQTLGLSVLLQVFGLVTPLFTQVVIDKVLVHRSLSTLDILVVGMAVVTVFQIWIGAIRGYIFTKTANQVDVQLNSRLFQHLTALPLKYFESWQSGDIVARVREIETVRQFIINSGVGIILDTVFALIYLIIMLSYSLVLSLVSLVAIIAFTALTLIAAPIYKARLQKRFLIGAQNQAFLIETLTGIQTVKAMAVEPHYMQKWERLQSSYIKSGFETVKLANVVDNLGQFIQGLFSMTVLLIGSYAIMDQKLTIGQLVAFQMLASLVIAPILRLITVWQYFQQTAVSIDRLGDILNATAEPAFNPNRTTLPDIKGNIVLDHVTFRYRPDTSAVLNDLSLHIRPGTRVGIVGPSGSGKSTLTKIIQRLYVPESGRILIDGVDLIQVEPAWLRRQIGVVLQENFLFNGSIRENIAIARPEATLAEVVAAAKTAGAHDFVTALAHGYETTVGERGAALSGGQRQRIAIARTLMSDPRILIFDEATSSLDYEAEREIIENLDRVAEGRTTLVIAHRLSTVRRCDRIIIVDHGRIKEEGTHEELLELQGQYYVLWKMQHGVGDSQGNSN